MVKYEKRIVDLRRLPDNKFIQFLRVEILDVRGNGQTFFGLVRYALDGIEQEEGLPLDLSKGIFIATLRDEQLGVITREELEKTLQRASVEITKIVRKAPNLKTILLRYDDLVYYDKCSTEKHNDGSVNTLKSILHDSTYLRYDQQHSIPPDLLRCRVIDPHYPRHSGDIYKIANKLSAILGHTYSVSSYGGSFNENDNLDEVWTRFSLVNFNNLKDNSDKP